MSDDDQPELSAWQLALTTHLSGTVCLSAGRYEVIRLTGELWRDEHGKPHRVRLGRGQTFPRTADEAQLRWKRVPD